MRFSYLVPRGVILLLAWAFFAFAFDPAVRRTLVLTGQAVAGAKIDVGDLQTSFFPPALVVKHVRVANRFSAGKNLIEFADVNLQIEGRPLLKQSYVVTEGTLTGLRWGTSREDSGRVDNMPDLNSHASNTAKLFDSLGRKVSAFGKDQLTEAIKLAKLQLDPQQLETVQLAEELHERWLRRFEMFETRIKQLETRVKQIEDAVKGKPSKVLEQIEAYSKAALEANDLLAEVSQIRLQLGRLPQTADHDLRALDAARQRDQQAIGQKLEFFKLDANRISDSLLGPELAGRVEQAVTWIQWTREYLSRLTDRPEPERLRGVDVIFPRKHELPKFLIHRLKISGEADVGGETMPFEGIMTGLTSAPAVYGKPITLWMKGQGRGHVQLDAKLDFTQPTPVYNLVVAYVLPEKTETQLGDAEALTLNVSAGRTECLAELELVGDRLSGKVTLKQEPVDIVADVSGDVDDEVRQMVQSTLSNIRQLHADVIISGTFDDLSWKLHSNLGPQLAGGLNRVLAQKVKSKRRQLARQVDDAAREQVTLFEKLLNDRYGQLVSRLNLSETHSRQLIRKVVGGRSFDLKKLFRR
jgi:uncharacterized protein (TIGR03545 family)